MGACNRSRGGVWPLFRYGVKWLCAFAGWHFTFGIGVPRLVARVFILLAGLSHV